MFFAKSPAFLFSVILGFGVSAVSKPLSFTHILSNLTSHSRFVVSDVPAIQQLQQALTLEEASEISQQMSYSQITHLENARFSEIRFKAASEKVNEADQVQNLIRKKPITFVIIPGLLGEFIDTRAFEEIFARPSYEKIKWQNNSWADSVIDDQFQLNKMNHVPATLRKLVDVASIDDLNGYPILKLVILRTHIGTLESVGDNQDRAATFNRRLEKYLKIDPSENLVFIGYSRGTPLALEMIVQAQKQHLPYLSNLQAVVSYAGVVMGSSLADITDDATTDSGRLFKAAHKLQASLKTSQSVWDRPIRLAQNSAAITEFVSQIALNSEFNPDSFLKTAMSGDFKTIAVLIAKVATQLGFKSITDFNGHVGRLKLFISEILKSVDGLKTKNLVKWWSANSLPQNVRFLSISAAMVDPNNSELEQGVFQAKIGYNDTLDDDSLQGNRRTYEKATGISLNDSQVAIYQSQFLPNLLGNLNSKNRFLKIESLGLLQTHHWGVSLQSVNAMKDGRKNPFPREKVLLALQAFLNQ